MKIVLENVQSKIITGGADGLYDPDLMKHLREYLSIDVPGSFFANKRLKWHWDGKKYFLTSLGKFATGFLSVLLKFIDEVYPDLEVEIIDERGSIPQFRSEFVDKVGPLEITEEYIHQKTSIQAFNNYITFRGQNIYFPRGVCGVATNGGKTAIIAGIYLNLITEERLLVVIHKKTVYRQLVQFFELVFGEVGQINDKEYKIKPITIAMIQTLYRHIDDINIRKDLAQFTVLAIDECHLNGAAMYAKVLVNCNASIRIGTSGTSFDSDNIVNKMISVGLLGGKLMSISKKELMDKGISTPVRIHLHLCNTILYQPVLVYADCIKKLIYESTERAAKIAQITRERSQVGPVLIAVDKTEHGKYLLKYLSDLNIPVELTHSKDKDIIPKIEQFKNGDIKVLISTSVLREGINLPLVQTIIYACGGLSKISLKQWMGRGERKSESKIDFEFHDFYDIGRFVTAHSKKRLQIYQSEQLEVITHYDSRDVKNMHSVIVR